MYGGSLSLKQLRDRGFDDAKIADMGGVIQGRNVLFKDKIGGFDSLGDIIRLKPLPKPKTTQEWLKENGSKIWGNAHQWALSETDLSEEHVTAWLTKYIYNWLPAKCQCRCRPHWDAMMERTPPPYNSSNREMADWLYDRHDEVNIKLGRNPLGRDAARKTWESSQ